MIRKSHVSRRGFVGGAAAALGYLGVKPGADLWAEGLGDLTTPPLPQQEFDFDSYARLGANENPYGPSESVLEAMTRAFKYSNTYGDPGEDLQSAIAERDGVERENIMTTAGSGEVLEVVGLTFLGPGKKVVGVEPSYSQVYRHATSIKAEAITLPLLDDYRQHIPSMIETTRANYRDVGFVYLCNPNNPTGRTVSAAEVEELLDGIPEDVPVLIDEAYHHFVQDPSYATAIPHVLEGRPVIVARTFSKIYGMAGIRLGYAVATPEMIRRLRIYSTGSVSVISDWAGVASLKDRESEERVKRITIELRDKTTAELEAMGHSVIPSETNFFMVHIGRSVQEVRDEFRKKGIQVGRPFPPMLEHLRVSVGNEDDMNRFMKAFKEIFPASTTDAGSDS